MNLVSLALGFALALALVALSAFGLFRLLQRRFLTMMIREIPSPLPYDATVNTLQTNLNNKPGWHVFNTIDQGREITAHGGEPIGRMTILQFCHGPFASRMFADESRRRMSVFSPRSVAVYEKADGQAYVAIMNGDLMMNFSPPATRSIIREVARDVKSMLAFLHPSAAPQNKGVA
ncbi:MAG: DUF302 domain-containing protein [Kiritimatiellae bacterium]|nr:DUF302 domain-containing protein [Kiritimatiellia bacterium]